MNIKTLCSAPVEVAQVRCAALVPDAESIRDKFQTAFELFGSCHKIYDSTEVDTNSIALLSKLTSKQYSGHYNCNLHYVGTNIKGFMGYYRQHFPNATVLPKMHMLECHVPGWLEKWGVGLGLMGEQGAESIHSSFNSIEKSYHSMPNRVERLLCVVKEHHLRVDPDHRSMVPEPKRRKKNSTPNEE